MAGTDLDKVREIFEARNRRQAAGGNFFSPQDGETLIRILPSTNDDGLFFKETGEHNIDGQRHYCPKLTKGDRCPICEKVNELYRSGDPDDAKIAKSFKVRKKYYSNIIVRGKEEEGPKIWGYGIKMWEKLLTFFMDADFGDLTDTKSGFDFKLIRTQKDGFPNYDSSFPRTKPEPLSKDSKKSDEWLKAAHDLDALVDPKLKTYEELRAIMLNEPIENEAPAPTISRPTTKTTESNDETEGDADLDAIMNEVKAMGKRKELA